MNYKREMEILRRQDFYTHLVEIEVPFRDGGIQCRKHYAEDVGDLMDEVVRLRKVILEMTPDNERRR
jgi:hypothetical protein